MMRGLLIILSLVFALALPAMGQETQRSLPSADAQMLNLGLRGVYFVPNEGQWSDGTVCYGFKSRGLDVAFRESSFTMHLRREVGASNESKIPYVMAEDDSPSKLDGPLAADEASEAAQFESLMLTVTFPESNAVQPEGADPRATKFNYFIGDDESKWASNVCSFGSIIYPDLYDGIDLHVCGSDDGVLKYEFHVAPGADYNKIRIAYDGIDGLCIDDAGDLHISTAFGTLSDSAPVAWQDIDGERRVVTCMFKQAGREEYDFDVNGPVDPAREFVIDPDVKWSYYIGGSGGNESVSAIAVAAEGGLYLTGTTDSLDFLGGSNSIVGNTDVWVLTGTSPRTPEWITFFGGSGYEGAAAISLVNDHILIYGSTGSYDLPRSTNQYFGGQTDCYLASVGLHGGLRACIYLGGSSTDEPADMTTELNDAVFVCGRTRSPDFVGKVNEQYGYYDGFVSRLSLDGTIEWMAYLGGVDSDEARDIAYDGKGAFFVCGGTVSHDFFGRINRFPDFSTGQGFVSKVEANGTLDWSMYLGGSGSNGALGVVTDAAGNAVLVGSTSAPNFPGARNRFAGVSDGFLALVDTVGAVRWSYYVGGGDGDGAGSIATTSEQIYYISGSTWSADFPSAENSYAGLKDTFVGAIDSRDGTVRWSRYIGGSDQEVNSAGVVLGPNGTLFVGGYTWSEDMPNQSNSYFGGRVDGFCVMLSGTAAPALAAESSCPSGGPIQVAWSDATAHGQAVLAFSEERGHFQIPRGQRCEGTVLGLQRNHLQIVFVGPAGANGSRTLNSNAGPGICGGYLQLVDGATCRTSNVVQIQ